MHLKRAPPQAPFTSEAAVDCTILFCIVYKAMCV